MKRVLIVCTGNSCRSQMGEGLVNSLWGGEWEAHSAGTKPSSLNRRAVEAMREIGIDISGQRSKNLDEFASESFDAVMTVCSGARDECPYFPGAGRMIHIPIPDPAPFTDLPDEAAMPHFRQARNMLKEKLERVLRELGVNLPQGTPEARRDDDAE